MCGVNWNERLIKAPMFGIDYVIVHELAHLFESNHTGGIENPSLMLGTAGTGYFYLRLAEPEKVPTLLIMPVQ